MIKVFLLLILSSTGMIEGVREYTDLAICEQDRLELRYHGHDVASECVEVNYKPDLTDVGERVKV